MSETQTILARLGRLFPASSKSTLRAMVEQKRVLLNGAPVRSLKQALGAQDRLEVVDAGRRGATECAEGLRIVYSDADIVVVDKDAGLLTATDAVEKRPTALAVLRRHFENQGPRSTVYLVHRLDRDASGLLVFARTLAALQGLKRQFFRHSAGRRYDVVVHGVPAKARGRLEHRLVEDERGVMHVTTHPAKGKAATLDYAVVRSDARKRLAHLECTLLTGRKHQIRVQLAAVGHAVCSDPVYGKGDEPPGRLALHASQLALDHPRSGRRMTFESPMPKSFGRLLGV